MVRLAQQISKFKMSTLDENHFTCEKHPYLGFTSQKALDKHLKFAPSHKLQNTPQPSGSGYASPVLGAVSVNDDERWSSISVSEELEILGLLLKECHTVKDLLKERHFLHTFTDEELEGFQQCSYCGSKFCPKICQNHRAQPTFSCVTEPDAMLDPVNIRLAIRTELMF